MSVTRRRFLHDTATTTAAVALASLAELRAAEAPSKQIHVDVIGTNGPVQSLASRFASLPGCKVGYICDPDTRAQGKGASAVDKAAGYSPQTIVDFRKALDDKSVDAVVIAAPDHWHAPATILACSAGKHVYVEKPCSHNAQEGEWMVAAARKHNRHVQMGTQRRSMPGIREGIEKLHNGAIGRVLYAQCFYFNPRPGIGQGKAVPVPEYLDYSLWQGPAPERPYRDNMIHYNWHWMWHWGTAELGNNGVHMIDVARWGLQVDYPTRVSCSGGRYRYQDDQETPDTAIANFEFGDKQITWEGRSWYRRRNEDPAELAFYGEAGTLVITGNGYKVYDVQGKETDKGSGDGSDLAHTQNLLDAIRNGAKLNQEILEGHKSTLLCHLGNIAYRTSSVLACDAKNGHLVGNAKAGELWGREYRTGWEPKV